MYKASAERMTEADRELIQLLLEDRRAMQASLDALTRLAERSHTLGEDTEGTTARRTHHSEPKLTKFCEASDDVEAYLTTFERLMGAHEVDTTRWAYLLAPQLTGRAQQAFAAGSYEDVKAAILVRYDINDETYRQRFRAASCKDGETYQELAVRTLDLLNKWMKDYKDDPQKILEQIATEQLLGKMTREIQIYVRERKPESAMQAGGLADDYVQARRPLRDGTKVQEKTENSTRCQYCEKRGHTAKECRKAAADRSSSSSSRTETAKWKDTRVCYSCKEVGHIAPNCPRKKPSDAA